MNDVVFRCYSQHPFLVALSTPPPTKRLSLNPQVVVPHCPSAIWDSVVFNIHSGADCEIFSMIWLTWKHRLWICLSQVGRASRAEITPNIYLLTFTCLEREKFSGLKRTVNFVQNTTFYLLIKKIVQCLQ